MFYSFSLNIYLVIHLLLWHQNLNWNLLQLVEVCFKNNNIYFENVPPCPM